MKKRKIAILACLSSLDPNYSIATVVKDQLKMLKQNGEDIVFITSSDFTSHDQVPKDVEVRYYDRYKGNLENIDILEFEKYVFETSSILRNNLKDCTHVFQHELLFLDSFIALNWAVRECINLLPKLKWFHWQHSAPNSIGKDCVYPYTGCYLPAKNSKFIYLNRTDITKVAEKYNIPENDVIIVHNPIDFDTYFKLHPLTIELLNHYDILSADTICIYPTRVTEAKQPHKVIRLLEKMKEEQKVKLIICNTWSNAEREKEFIANLKKSSLEDDLIFTSEFKSQWAKDNDFNLELGIPREVISDLLRLSDLFILPSISECCSMIMLEAAANKNLVILNDDLHSLKEFGGQKMWGDKSSRAFYMEFGSLTRPIGSYLPSEDHWYKDHAEKIIREQKENSSIGFFKFVRKRHNLNWVYHNEIKPLFL